jgi:hypothetical protein
MTYGDCLLPSLPSGKNRTNAVVLESVKEQSPKALGTGWGKMAEALSHPAVVGKLCLGRVLLE